MRHLITISITCCIFLNDAIGTSVYEAKIRTTAPSFCSKSSAAFASTTSVVTRERRHYDSVQEVFDKTSFLKPLVLSSSSSPLFSCSVKTRMNLYSNQRKAMLEDSEHNQQPHKERSSTKKETRKSSTNPNRRNVLAKIALLVFASTNAAANAACLSGDTSPQCIGVYKMPIDDRTNVYIETPEQLAKYAPDVKWVPAVTPPKSYKEARLELTELQINCFGDGSADNENVNSLVLKGQLEKAGIELLRIVPRITVVGRVIIGALYGASKNDKATTTTEKTATTVQQESLSMRAYRAEVAYDELLGQLGEVDVLIGQALRGQLGVSAAAQIQILAELKDAKGFLDDFVKAVPDDFRG